MIIVDYGCLVLLSVVVVVALAAASAALAAACVFAVSASVFAVSAPVFAVSAPSYLLQRQLPRRREPRPSLVCFIKSAALRDPTGDMARLQRAESDAALHTGPNASSGVPAHSIIPTAAPAAS